MAGRTPKPTALKLIEGNRGKRAVNAHEPEPMLLNDLEPPAHLPAAHAEIWQELAPKLRRAQVLTELDAPLLEMTCAAIATFRLTARHTAEGKLLQRNEETGSISLSPYTMLQSMAFKQALAALKEWGATPAARSRVMIDPQTDLFGPSAAAGASRFFQAPK